MRIAIIGAGRVGGALATALRRAGHTILFGVRDPADPRYAAIAATASAALLLPAYAAQAAEVVVLSLPWRAAEEAVTALGDLRGKVVIDCMNPLAMRDGELGLVVGFDASGAETVAAWLPGAHVVKTLNQVGAETMADAGRYPIRPAMLMAGDDFGTKGVVAGLLSEIGFEPLDVGGLKRARLLEPFGMAWIALAMAGRGRDWAFAAVKPA